MSMNQWELVEDLVMNWKERLPLHVNSFECIALIDKVGLRKPVHPLIGSSLL